jgi:hypothetical protein
VVQVHVDVIAAGGGHVRDRLEVLDERGVLLGPGAGDRVLNRRGVERRAVGERQVRPDVESTSVPASLYDRLILRGALDIERTDDGEVLTPVAQLAACRDRGDAPFLVGRERVFLRGIPRLRPI